MQFLNKIELKGVVGRVTRNVFGSSVKVSILVVTNYAFRDRDGNAVLETTWHNVTIWQNDGEAPLPVEKGSKVHVVGRLKQYRYVNHDGIEIPGYEILANSIEVFPDERLEDEIPR